MNDLHDIEAYCRSFGYIPPGEWIGDNIVETDDPFRMPTVLREFQDTPTEDKP